MSLISINSQVITARVVEYLQQNPGKEFTCDHLATVSLRGEMVNDVDQITNFRKRMYYTLNQMAKNQIISRRRTKTAFKKSALLFSKPNTEQPHV